MLRYYSMIMLRGYIYKLDMVFEGAITREANFIVCSYSRMARKSVTMHCIIRQSSLLDPYFYRAPAFTPLYRTTIINKHSRHHFYNYNPQAPNCPLTAAPTDPSSIVGSFEKS